MEDEIKFIERKIFLKKKLQKFIFHPFLEKIYLSRGIKNIDELNYSFEQLIPTFKLKNCDVAAEILVDAIAKGEKLVIIGDYDVDGATSTALLLLFLKKVNANVSYLIPDRKKYGYGLTKKIVESSLIENPNWLITVDNGITSFDGIVRAKELGIKVLITDHHLQAKKLPSADCIVNPNQTACNFPSKFIAGVGVVFYIIIELRKKLKEINWFKSDNYPNLAIYLDLVALGTIADVVNLDKNNRILVYNGLKRIRKGFARPGINALINICKKKHNDITCEDLAFLIAPKLNAAGRLKNMNIGVECLICEDLTKAEKYAQLLFEINNKRQDKQKQMENESFDSLASVDVVSEHGIAIFNKLWHEGIIGIIASKIKDKYNRPTFVFAKNKENLLKGSGRSIKNINLKDVLENIDKHNPNLILNFGGHAMAAGLTIFEDKFDEFKFLFNKIIKKYYKNDLLKKEIFVDGPFDFSLKLNDINQIIDSIDSQVWGNGFEQPLFFNEFLIKKQTLLNHKHSKLKLIEKRSLSDVDGIFFNNVVKLPSNIKLVYKIGINRFKGVNKKQIVVSHWQSV